MKKSIFIGLFLWIAAAPIVAQKINCGDRYRAILEEADQLFQNGKYLASYEKYRAARGCSEADLKAIDEKQYNVLKAAEEAEKRAQDNLRRAEKLAGHFDFGPGKNVAWAHKNGYFGLINRQGDALSKFVYETTDKFDKGLALVKTNNQYVFVGDDGQEKIPERYDFAIETDLGLWFMGRTTGEYSLDYDFYDVSAGKDKIASYMNVNSQTDGGLWLNKDSLWGYTPKLEVAPAAFMYQYVHVLDGPLNAVQMPAAKKGKPVANADNWGFVNKQGKLVVPTIYKEINLGADFQQENLIGVAIMDRDSQIRWGFIDTLGKTVIDYTYQQVHDFEDDRAWVQNTAGTYDQIDRQGNVVLQTDYTEVAPLSNGRWAVGRMPPPDSVAQTAAVPDSVAQRAGATTTDDYVEDEEAQEVLHGMTDNKGNVIIPLKYLNIQVADDDALWVANKPDNPHLYYVSALWSLVDLKGNPIDTHALVYAEAFIGNFANVQSMDTEDGLYYDEKAELFNRATNSIDTLYDSFIPNYNENSNRIWLHEKNTGKSSIGKNALWQLTEKDGTILYEGKSNDVTYFRFGPYSQVHRNNRWIWVDSCGRSLSQHKITVQPQWTFHHWRAYQTTRYDSIGIVDTLGRHYFDPQFKGIFPAGKNTFWANGSKRFSQAEKAEFAYGLFDLEGRQLVSFDQGFEEVNPLGGGYFRTADTKNGEEVNVRLRDSTGRSVLPFTVVQLYALNQHLIQFFRYDTLKIAGQADSMIVVHGIFKTRNGEFLTFSATNILSYGYLPVEQQGKWGWLDSTGNWVVQPRFDEAVNISPELMLVRENDKWGWTDYSGRLLVTPRFDGLGEYRHGLMEAQLEGKWYLADKTGRLVSEPLESPVGSNLIAPNRQFFHAENGKWGIKDFILKKDILPAVYDGFRVLDQSYYCTKKLYETVSGDRKGCVDSMGNIILPAQYGWISNLNDRLLLVKKGQVTDTVYYIADMKGNFIPDLEVSMHTTLGLANSDLIITSPCKNGPLDKCRNVRLLSPAGKPILPGSYDDITLVQAEVNTYFLVREKDTYRLVDHTGKVLANERYEYIRELKNGNAWVTKDPALNNLGLFEWGLIDTKNGGREIVKPQFNNVDLMDDGVAIVSQNGLNGVISKEGTIILPCQYAKIYAIGKKIWMFELNGRLGMTSPAYGIDIPPVYEEFGLQGEAFGWLRAKKNGKWGWIDKKGQVMIPFRYDSATPFYEGRAAVQQMPYPGYFYIDKKGLMLMRW